MNRDSIHVRGLRVDVLLGVPDAERAVPQEISIDLVMTPGRGFDGLGDDIACTVDYHAVVLRVEAIVKERPRRLVETLAVEIAEALLDGWPLVSVEVGIDKYILPQTRAVGVRVRRERGHGPSHGQGG